ncbi:MAG: hypothetical protein ACREM1_16115, partial [Longimicrobiales bacterium]
RVPSSEFRGVFNGIRTRNPKPGTRNPNEVSRHEMPDPGITAGPFAEGRARSVILRGEIMVNEAVDRLAASRERIDALGGYL